MKRLLITLSLPDLFKWAFRLSMLILSLIIFCLFVYGLNHGMVDWIAEMIRVAIAVSVKWVVARKEFFLVIIAGLVFITMALTILFDL